MRGRVETMPCLDDMQLQQLLHGALLPEQRLQIEGHLDVCLGCQALVCELVKAEPLVSSDATRWPEAPPTEEFTDAASDALGRRYILLARIGRGGMGQVYRVLDRLTGQTVALKWLALRSRVRSLTSLNLRTGSYLASLSLHAKRLALAREFSTLASLRHPHIISVLDYGFDDHHEPYFTMELLEDCSTVLDFAATAPQAVRIELLVQLLRALSYLHRRGTLHRDLKPTNILVRKGALGPKLTVLDFGLALLRDEAREAPAAGTLRYMAPELLCGKPASEASELYAVGILAYQMITGRYPFRADRDARQLIAQALHTEPDLSALQPVLQQVIGRALQKSPSARYADATTFAAELAAATLVALPREPVALRDSYLIAAQFIGRDAELGVLRTALQMAKSARGAALLVGGEAGSGKSRLMEELRRQALTEGVLVARGQAVASGVGGYLVWHEVLDVLTLHCELDELELQVLGTVLPRLATIRGRTLAPPPELDAQGARLRLLRVLTDLVERIPTPTLLLLEDLQWADAESLTLLDHLSRACCSLPVLIVGTYRDDERPRLPDELTETAVLHLPRLTSSEMQRLCGSMLGPMGTDPQLVALIEKETEGNTFFIVETIRALADSAGSLAAIGRGAIPKQLLNHGVDQILDQRLGRAPMEAQSLLRLAAVAGRQLDLAVLAECCAYSESLLQVSAEVGILEVHEQRWRFSHDKLRARLLEQVGATERAALHGQVAQSLERVYASNPAQAAQVAHHYHQAGQLAKAARYYALAGAAALTRGAAAEAMVALNQALALQQPDATKLERVRIWRTQAQARYALGQLHEADAAVEQVCRLAGQPLPANLPSWGRAFLRQGSERLVRGTRLARYLARGRYTKEEQELRWELLYALSILEIYIWLGQPRRLVLFALWGSNLHDALSGTGSYRTLFNTTIAMLLVFAPFGSRALNYLSRTARAPQKSTFWNVELLRARSIVAQQQGRWSAALVYAEQAVAMARAQRDETALLHSLHPLQLALCDMDQFRRVLVVSQELEALARRAQNTLFLSLALTLQAGALLRLGEQAAAADLFERAQVITQGQLGPVLEAALYGLSALCALRSKQLRVAQERADRALDAVSSTGLPLAQLRYALIGILSVYLSEEYIEPSPRTQEALASLQRTARLFKTLRPALHLYRGLYHFRQNSLMQAYHYFHHSVQLAGQYKVRYEEGWANYWLGRLARTWVGQHLMREGAAIYFDSAAAVFVSLEAAWDLEQVRQAMTD